MQWRPDGLTRWKHRQSFRQQKHRPASWPHGIKGDSQEGLNRHGARNLIYKATYKRVLIGVVYVILGEDCKGNTSQVDKNVIVRDTSQLIKWGDINLVSKKG